MTVRGVNEQPIPLLPCRTTLWQSGYYGVVLLALTLTVLLVACTAPLDSQQTRHLPTPSPVKVDLSPIPIVLPSVAPDSHDPFVGRWMAVHPASSFPHTLVVKKDPDGRYTFYASDGTIFSPANEQDASLYFHLDAFFSHPWQRYTYDATTDQLRLITADDVDHPKHYRRSQ